MSALGPDQKKIMQVSHDAPRSNYIINLSLTRDPSFTMELLDVNASFLSVSSMLYVHCLDFDSRSHIVASNLACCKFLTVLGHVSFPKSLRERRLCLFVESDKLKDLGNKASPAVINVKSSCIHKLENEDDDDYGRHVLVIFEFEILTNQTSVAVSLQPYDDYEEENAIEEMPWLDITLVDCNCSRFPNTTNIAVQNGIDPHASYDSNESNSSEGEPSESEDDQTGDATDSIEDNEEITHYTEYFKVKGSTYHGIRGFRPERVSPISFRPDIDSIRPECEWFRPELKRLESNSKNVNLNIKRPT